MSQRVLDSHIWRALMYVWFDYTEDPKVHRSRWASVGKGSRLYVTWGFEFLWISEQF